MSRSSPRETSHRNVIRTQACRSTCEIEKLKRVLLAMPTVKSEAELNSSVRTTTPALALHRKRLMFCVRKQDRELVQTVKAEDPAEGDILERREWECGSWVLRWSQTHLPSDFGLSWR
jgi:hypothetical protein